MVLNLVEEQRTLDVGDDEVQLVSIGFSDDGYDLMLYVEYSGQEEQIEESARHPCVIDHLCN